MNCKMPQISIVIPVYNVERYLCKCIDSVISQSFKNWEMILVNDGSRDGSLAICQEYAAKYDAIKVIDKPNGGPSSARNRGLDEVQGEYVYFMDADDWIEKNFLETFFRGSDNENVNIVNYCGAEPYDIIFQGFVRELTDGEKEESFAMDSDTSVMSKEDIICCLYKEHAYGWSWCKLFRREIIEKFNIRFDESLRLWEDELFTTEFLKQTVTVRTINSHLYHYVYHPESLMNTNNSYLKRLFLSEKMNEALEVIANEELKEYINSTYNGNLKYSLIMALKNEANHDCDIAIKETLLDRYYVRCREYPSLKLYNVLSSKIPYIIVECLLRTKWKWLIIKVMSMV